MANIIEFLFNEEQAIRTALINDEAWFMGADVAQALGYTKPRNAILEHVDLEDKKTINLQKLFKNQSSALNQGGTGNLNENVCSEEKCNENGGLKNPFKNQSSGVNHTPYYQGNPNAVFINESGLYALIFSSKLSQAKEFKRWVTSEVLPSLRKHGSYCCKENLLSDERNSSLFDVLSCNNDIDAGKQGSEAGSMLFSMLNNQSMSCTKVFEELKAFNHNLNQLKQLNPAMLRFFLYSFTASLRYEAMCCEARSRMLMRIEGIVEELSAVNKDENLNKEYKGKACDRLLKRLFKAITGAEKEIEELTLPYALIKKGGAA